jgi:ribonucleotide monophosphatase NagD (HAD superfamily)
MRRVFRRRIAPVKMIHWVANLRRFGIETSEEHVYSSALATAEFVHTQRLNGTAFVIGEGGLLNALNEVNYAINRDAPDYVIVGEGRVLNFELVERAHRLIANGANLLSTKSDTWRPTDSGPRPGCGATDLGFRSILVLTGSTTIEALRDYPFAPTYVARSIADVAGVQHMMPLDAQ